ncbi:hypothetical protein I3760_09G110700 [Carya illinoinensis]|nr:hypothetical protein I3760_09G110700 [Carya illinoinensis]
MSLKFLNKKVWHTGSLRNIENIQEERERSEFRLLQEQAGLVPKQDRLEFLYDSGLAVGKGGNSEGFKALESFPKTTSGAESTADTAKASSSSAVPGALFEEKPHSANDAWRKLHSDPLLMIRQRVQETLARIKNPLSRNTGVFCAKVEEQKPKKKAHSEKEPRMKHHHSHLKNQKHSSSRKQSDSENVTAEGGKGKTSRHKNSSYDVRSGSEDESTKRKSQSPNMTKDNGQDAIKRNHDRSEWKKFYSGGQRNLDVDEKKREGRGYRDSSHHNGIESHFKCCNVAPKLSEEERAAKLHEMQVDAELHEEQRWKQTTQASLSGGRSFLDAAQKSIYGAEKGGSSTIEESVRCRTHYLQGRSEAQERNAFRR